MCSALLFDVFQNTDSSWLNLKTVKLLLCDGGILDLDDRINDVIDDKEQV